MNFTYNEIKKLSLYLSRDYSDQIFHILLTYETVSASELASQLDLHIKTVQDFLEALADLKLLEAEKVVRHKRPYFRYKLIQDSINLNIDLSQVQEKSKLEFEDMTLRMTKLPTVMLNTVKDSAESVTLFLKKNRRMHQKKIKFTPIQGKFLKTVPAHNSSAALFTDLLKKAEIEEKHLDEIKEIVQILITNKVLDKGVKKKEEAPKDQESLF